MSLKQIVGQKTYSVWVEMLQQLVPEGRTHRLAPLVAGMLQYASDMAYQKYGDNPAESSAAQVLFMASELYDPAEAKELSELVEQLFTDAKVNFERVSSRGDEYSVIESTIYEYIHWYDMPWEA
jgi:hypothetical protein